MTLRDIIGSFLPLDEGRRKVAVGMFVVSLLFVALMWAPGIDADTRKEIIGAVVWTVGLVTGGNAVEWFSKRGTTKA